MPVSEYVYGELIRVIVADDMNGSNTYTLPLSMLSFWQCREMSCISRRYEVVTELSRLLDHSSNVTFGRLVPAVGQSRLLQKA